MIDLALLFLAGFTATLTLVYIWLHRNDPQAWHKDWFCFYSAGGSFLENGAGATYRVECIEGQFWLYPPYMLYPYALGSLLPPLKFFSIVVLEILAVTILSLKLGASALAESRSFKTLGLVALASAPFAATLVMGQHSALLLLGAFGGLWGLRSGRPVLAGIFFGLLGIKPNWALIFVLLLLVTRRWRTLAAMAAVGVLMIVSTLPMGLAAWHDYLTYAPRWIQYLLNADGSFFYPAHKLITLEAFARSTIGLFSPDAGRLLWLGLEILTAAACLFVWWTSEDERDQVALAILAAVAANVYVEFYDGLTLVLPAAVWWTGRERYPDTVWRVVGGLLGVLWLWFWVWALAVPGPRWPSLVGGFVFVWMAFEVYRIHQAPRARTSQEQPSADGAARSG